MHYLNYSYLSLFILISLFAITPGPGTIFVFTQTVILNLKKTLFIILGMSTTNALIAYFVTSGLVIISSSVSFIAKYISLLGGCYLLWLSYQLYKNHNTKITLIEKKLPQNNNISLFFQGMVFSSSNPKVIVFYLSVLPNFFNQNTLSTISNEYLIVLSVIVFIGLFGSLLTLAFLTNKIRFVIEKYWSKTNILSAILLCFVAIILILRAF